MRARWAHRDGGAGPPRRPPPPRRQLRAETLGYVVRGRRTVYFAGDTELFDGMADLCHGMSEPSRGRRSGRPPAHPSSTSRCCRSRAGARRSAPATWTRSTPRARLGLLRAAHRDPDPLGNAAADRQRPPPPGPARRPAAPVRRHVARLAPSVEVRILTPGRRSTAYRPVSAVILPDLTASASAR